MVLRRWGGGGGEYKIIWFYQLTFLALALAIRYNEGLALETSPFQLRYGDQFTLSTQLIKPNYLRKILVVKLSNRKLYIHRLTGSLLVKKNRKFT